MSTRLRRPARSASPGKLAALRAVHPFPSLLVSGLTVALIPLADRGAPASLYLVLGLGMLLFQCAIGLVNDVVDAGDDAVAKPWKPVANGTLPRRTAMGLAGGCASAGLLVTAGLEGFGWWIGLAGLACGLSYDLYFKRTFFSWLPWSLAFPLLPVWVYVATDEWQPFLRWVFPLGGLLGLALHLANQAPDAAADRDRGIVSPVQWLGERRSRHLAVGVFVSTGLGAAVLLTEHAGWLAGGVASVAAATAAALAPWATRLLGRDGLFLVLAAASAALAVGFFSAL